MTWCFRLSVGRCAGELRSDGRTKQTIYRSKTIEPLWNSYGRLRDCMAMICGKDCARQWSLTSQPLSSWSVACRASCLDCFVVDARTVTVVRPNATISYYSKCYESEECCNDVSLYSIIPHSILYMTSKGLYDKFSRLAAVNCLTF